MRLPSRKYYYFNYSSLKNTGSLIIKGTIFNIAGYIKRLLG